VYTHTRSIFVDADLALIRLFIERLEPFASELTLQPLPTCTPRPANSTTAWFAVPSPETPET
jgi:hypothetical protein